METSFRTIRCINPTREWKVKPEVNPYQTVRISCREIFFIVRNTRFPWHASSIKVWHVCFSFTIQRNCCIKIFIFENNNDWFINIIYVVYIYIHTWRFFKTKSCGQLIILIFPPSPIDLTFYGTVFGMTRHSYHSRRTKIFVCSGKIEIKINSTISISIRKRDSTIRK